MKVVEGLLRSWQQSTCSHQWLRARWEDGSYGLRCGRCMLAYPRTWNDLLAGDPVAPEAKLAASAELTHLRRAA